MRSCWQLSVPTPSFPQKDVQGVGMWSQESKYLVSNLNIPSPGKATFPQASVPSTYCNTTASCCCASRHLHWDGKDNPWMRAMVEQESDAGPDPSLAVGRDTGLQHNLLLEAKPARPSL